MAVSCLRALNSKVSLGLLSVWSLIIHPEFYFQSQGVNLQSSSLNKFHLTYLYFSSLIRDHCKVNSYPTRHCVLFWFRCYLRG